MSEVEQRSEQPESGEKTAAAEGYLYALDKQEAIALRQWWWRLVMDQQELKRYTKQWPYPRGVRAALRRCATIESVMLTEAFRHLWQALESRAWEEAPPKASRDQRLTTWAVVAAVASELRAETFDASLGKRLGVLIPSIPRA
ncbi:hypothetical protein HORIV_61740 [Vreelandella olivaria]|uniref:Uncharacterized protein n=1 Tax=Vreelandella olivaria TaxID=390919 RepID=A0ABM7GSX5_9GAMM|nr:hypothetical protein HORIV_61740 [Halomonas olivaria]